VIGEQQLKSVRGQCYNIVIAGELDLSWSGWLGGMQVATGLDQDGKSITTLSGEILDQAALRSILNKIWDLSLTVLSVTRVHETFRENPKEVNYE